MAEVRLFGIRHHGPGSAHRLLAALETLRPAVVLIEGPADLSDALVHLAHPGMVPPIALLAYAEAAPERAIFWPFAEYSPEYQAAVWALRYGAEVAFIDLPAAAKLGDGPDEGEGAAPVLIDPIGTLARAAGYEDGESWWSDVIEENPDPGEVFDAVAAAMTALREGHEPDVEEARREAHMRRAIARAAKEATGPVAVVCGAWHVPALAQKSRVSDDAALLKDLPKAKIKATWAPWTSARLSRRTGYGAGVVAPGWYSHLWAHGSGTAADARWISAIAGVLRDGGDVVSTASVIETVRLGTALAALRDRPAPGFAELRDAAQSALMGGDTLAWTLVESRLLLGNEVGSIPPDLPLTPLLEDLTREQKRLRLKPEALERELAIDLRSDGGQDKSTLLHRLLALDVPWGRPIDAGRSRGTFREKWTLMWDPDFTIRLVESLIYGPTIAAAAGARMTEAIGQEARLAVLADHVHTALTAQLPDVAAAGIGRLAQLAAGTDDCVTLLGAVPAIVDTLRYGSAREVALDQMEALLDRLIVQGAIALPYGARNLDADAARDLHGVLDRAHRAIALAERGEGISEAWVSALSETGLSLQASPMVAGLCARLSYEGGAVDVAGVADLLSRRLSRAVPAADSAAFFEGFFLNVGMKLVHDAALRGAVDGWVMELEADAFIENLPFLRRVFSGLDKAERRVLFEHLLGKVATGKALSLAVDADRLWAAQMAVLGTIFDGGAPDGQG